MTQDIAELALRAARAVADARLRYRTFTPTSEGGAIRADGACKRDAPCACGHTYWNHDTGWDASGCMVGACTCRSFREAR